MKKPSVTVAICALNEESNIKACLTSVLQQKKDGYILDKILVISDGSTDDTVKVIKSLRSPLIKIVDHKKRIGKSSRLNEIYSSLTSDIVVQPDADVIFANPNVISSLVKPFVEDKRVGMTGGHPLPLPAKTFTEKAVNCTLEAYIPLREVLKDGNNALSATGRIMALRKELAKQITVPANTISNDGFAYFSCITKGFLYRYVREAVVYFRSPQNLYDHLNQNTRFDATPMFMKRYFPADVVDREYFIPAGMLYKNMLKQFIKHPILCGYIFVVNKICYIKARIDLNKINAMWEVVYSTKRLRQTQ